MCLAIVHSSYSLLILQLSWGLKGWLLFFKQPRIIHDSMNIPKIEWIAYIYILLWISKI